MLCFLFLACSTPAPTGSDALSGPMGDKAEIPSGDAVLQRHLDATRQCDLLTSDSFLLRWDAITTNTKKLAYEEKVMLQGRRGSSFTRIHERTRPNWGFSGFGRQPDGVYWSATQGGVVHRITDESVTNSMMKNLDPTPLCAFQARWKDRVNLGSEEHGGRRAWHLMLTWADGTTSEAWFAEDDGLLMELLTSVEGFERRRTMKDYAEHEGVYWPTEEISVESRDGQTLIVASRLTDLVVGRKGFIDLGPRHIEALLAKKVTDGVLQAPQK